MKSKRQLNLFRSNKTMSRDNPKSMLSTPRTFRQPRKKPWKCLKVPRMRPNSLPKKALLKQSEQPKRKSNQNKNQARGDSSVNLLIP